MYFDYENEKMPKNSNVAVYVLIVAVAAIVASIIAVVSLALVTMTDLDQCNSSVCVPSGCWNAYCNGADCVQERIEGCCDDQYCRGVNGSDYNFGTLHVHNISSVINSTHGTLVNSVIFKNRTIASVCLISDGSCTDTIGSAQVDTINVRSIESESSCVSAGDGFMTACKDGNLTMTGTVILDRVNVSNYACLRRALPLSGGFIDINGIKILQNSINASAIVVTGNITAANVTVTTQSDDIVVSGVRIVNNTAQGYVGGTNGVLLLNPDGGNVGLGMPTTNIDDVLFTAQAGGNVRADAMLFRASAETNGGTYSNGLSWYQKSVRTIVWAGPWASTITAPIVIERLGNKITVSLGIDLIANCSGNATSITSHQTLASLIDPDYANSNYDTRARVINNSVEVDGIFLIQAGYGLFSSTGLDINGQGIINGTTTNMCGVRRTTISYIVP
jgi:hypothetical protein